MRKADSLTPRKTPRQERAKSTVDAILTAAAHILVEVGYERANVNDVARRAGVSIGSLYQYYPSKEALMGAVVRRHTDEMTAIFERAMPEMASLPLASAVREAVSRALAAFAYAPALRRVVVREAPKLAPSTLTPDWDAMIELAFCEFLKFHADRVRRKDIDVAARIVRVAVEAVASDFAVRDPEMLAEQHIVDEVVDLVARYLLADSA
jgi:AcrR family transcriptional regulator